MAGKRSDGSLSFEHRGECQDLKWHRGCAGLWRAVSSEARTTELVCRKELRPVLRTGATVMGELLAAGQ
jgi:hypothetical protein